MSIELEMLANHLILCCPLLLLPSIFPSIRLSSNESMLHIRWLKYWNFSISPSNVYWELISFRIGWLAWSPCCPRDFEKSSLAPQFESINSLVLCFFMVQLSYLYITTGRTKALTIWTFVGKVISLLFNMLSRFNIAFLQRSKNLLISWLQSPSIVNLEPRK